MSDISRSERSDRTRERLLAAGLELLRSESTERLFERLDARRVSQHVGVTTGAFYHHFEGPDEFVEALLRFTLRGSPNPGLAVAVPVFEAQLGEGASFVDAFVAATSAVLEYQMTDPAFSLLLAVGSKARHDVKVRATLATMYELVQRETSVYYELIMDRLGRELRPPFTLADLADGFLAVYEGLAMHQNALPDSVPRDRLGLLLLPTILLMTREHGDTEDVREWLDAHAPRLQDGERPPTDEP